jgi:hypothetical protein
MQLALKPHPDWPCAAVTAVAVDVTRPRAGTLRLSFEVIGDIDALRIPPTMVATRADELWRHTCFEAFIKPPAGAAYLEFNLAPSTEWAAYRFDGYRTGMRAAEVVAPSIAVQSAHGRLMFQSALELDALPPGRWRLGLAAVIEEAGGRQSYWALAHPPGKPDFHHADCFACEI